MLWKQSSVQFSRSVLSDDLQSHAVKVSGPASGNLKSKGNVGAGLVQEGEVRKRRERIL